MKSTKEKANYCIGCINKPCSKACPLNNDTAGFIKLIKEDKLQEAYNLLSETTVLQSICGRICPHTKQCEGKCIRAIKGEPVSIGELESYIGDLAIQNNWSFIENIEERKEKVGRNIKEDKSIIIPEHNIPAFKPSKTFANEVK